MSRRRIDLSVGESTCRQNDRLQSIARPLGTHETKMTTRTGKRSILSILRKNRGLEQSTLTHVSDVISFGHKEYPNTLCSFINQTFVRINTGYRPQAFISHSYSKQRERQETWKFQQKKQNHDFLKLKCAVTSHQIFLSVQVVQQLKRSFGQKCTTEAFKPRTETLIYDHEVIF